jgi:hypothetical protein
MSEPKRMRIKEEGGGDSRSCISAGGSKGAEGGGDGHQDIQHINEMKIDQQEDELIREVTNKKLRLTPLMISTLVTAPCQRLSDPNPPLQSSFKRSNQRIKE